MENDKYISIKELSDLKGVGTRAIRLAKDKYQTREITVKGGKSFEILLSSIGPNLQEEYLNKFLQIENKKLLPTVINTVKPDNAKNIALARYELIKTWQEQRKNQKCKTQFDTDFLSTYNSGFLYPDIYSKIGKVSIGTLERWKRFLDGSQNYELLLPNYHYSDYSRTTLTDFEKQIFLKLLLHPNKFSIGKAISLTQYILKNQNAEYIPAPPTFRRFANWYKNNYFDKWTLMREGEKALKEQVVPHIRRDISKIEVGEVLVADGKRLNFQVINPFTGKPTRATIIGFLDWKSGALVGYEIMIEENTQCVASALRNAILNLGKIPKFVYLDNGKAFKNNYFRGIYDNLGIITIYANPYNARSKVIERFWLEMQESFEKMLPSYIGTNIENKPVRLKRNENFHKNIHQNSVPTIAQTIQMIDSWLEYKNSQICPNDKLKTIKEMLETIEKQEINEQLLDDLMLAQGIKTITSQGIRFLNTWYFNDALYGLRQKVMIKYSLFDLSYIKVYTMNGNFLCRAERITLTHPLANYTGEIKDIEDYKQKIQKQKQLKNKTIKECKKVLNIEDLEIIQCDLIEEIVKELDEIPRFYTADIFRQCVNALKIKPQMIMTSERAKNDAGINFSERVRQNDKVVIVDEIDYLLADFKAIETLRDLHDKTGVPIILVGMKLAKHKLKKHTHLFDRISEIYHFEEFDLEDIKQIVSELSEIEIENDAIKIIHKKATRFRQLVRIIDKFECVAEANGLTTIDENIAVEVLNGK